MRKWGPQGSPKSAKREGTQTDKGSPNIALFQEGSPRGPRGAPETISERFGVILGSNSEPKLVENNEKKVSQKRVLEHRF